MMFGGVRVPPTPSTADTIAERLYRPVPEGPHVATVRHCDSWSVRSVYRTTDKPHSLDLDAWELGWRVRQAADTRDAIDKRLAEAVYESTTFVDYIGA